MEEWKSVNGTDYEVSSMGRVRNKRGRLLSGGVQSNGYRQVNMRGKMRLLHRLVMEAFDPLPSGTVMEVDHIDGDKQNNALTNLRWATRQQNSRNKKCKGFSQRGGKFVARVVQNGRIKYLGTYATAAEARQAYVIGAKQLDAVFYAHLQ